MGLNVNITHTTGGHGYILNVTKGGLVSNNFVSFRQVFKVNNKDKNCKYVFLPQKRNIYYSLFTPLKAWVSHHR